MTPKRSSARSGNTSANSVTVWPCWLREILCGEESVFCIGVKPCCFGEGRRVLFLRGRGKRTRLSFWLLEDGRDGVERRRNGAREEAEGDDDPQRDDGENHAVLRHGLTVLAPDEGLEHSRFTSLPTPGTLSGALNVRRIESRR